MGKSFNSLNALNSYLNDQIADAMGAEVFQVIKNVQREAIEMKVYSYQPRQYVRRRMQDGGLVSEGAFHKEIDRNNNKTTIKVSNMARRNSYHGDFSGGYLTPLIVYGHNWAESNLPEGGYAFSGNGYSYLKPRDFVTKTRQILKSEQSLSVALEYGLRRTGVQAKGY